jgi:hypothetical protein
MAVASGTGTVGKVVANVGKFSDAAQGYKRAVIDSPFLAQDSTQSGNLTVELGELNPGTRVLDARMRVEGFPFQGLLSNLSGATATVSPVVYELTGKPGNGPSGDRAFIVDFGGLRSVLALSVKDAGISLVLPWLGNDFSDKPIFTAATTLVDGSSRVGLTGIETTKLLIQVRGSSLPNAADFAGRCRIRTGTLPTNLRASVNGRPPFWTRPGALTEGAAVQGLAAELNAVAASLTEPAAATLTLQTDTPGVVVAPAEQRVLVVQQTATASWGGASSTDVVLQSLQPQEFEVPFVADKPQSWQVDRVEVELSAAFPPWRAYEGQVFGTSVRVGMRVDAQLSVARRVEFAQPAEVYGFALLVPADAVAEIRLDVLEEEEGGGPGVKPLAGADVQLLGGGGPDPRWHEVVLAAPFLIAARQGAWVAAKTKTGSFEWSGGLLPTGSGPTLYQREGGRWERYPTQNASPVAAIRLLRLPYPDENAPVLGCGWSDGKGIPSRVEAGRDVTSFVLERPDSDPVSLSPDAGTILLKLQLGALSSGTVSVRRLTASYREVTP